MHSLFNVYVGEIVFLLKACLKPKHENPLAKIKLHEMQFIFFGRKDELSQPLTGFDN